MDIITTLPVNGGRRENMLTPLPCGGHDTPRLTALAAIPMSGTGPGTGKKSDGKYAVTFTFLSGLDCV